MSFKSNISLPKASIFLLVVVVLLAVSANGSPPRSRLPEENERLAQFEPSVDVEVVGLPAQQVHQRFKRATCDLTSGTSVGSSLCAAHCLAKGFRGGYCNDKLVCVCRR